jgi:hypothetical protein
LVNRVLDGDTYEVVQQLSAGSMNDPGMPAATGEAQQISGIAAAKNVVSTGGDDGAEAYNVAQVRRKC